MMKNWEIYIDIIKSLNFNLIEGILSLDDYVGIIREKNGCEDIKTNPIVGYRYYTSQRAKERYEIIKVGELLKEINTYIDVANQRLGENDNDKNNRTRNKNI